MDDHRDRFGVEQIRRVLSEHGVKIAPNNYYAHKRRVPTACAAWDARVLAEIVRVFIRCDWSQSRSLGPRLSHS